MSYRVSLAVCVLALAAFPLEARAQRQQRDAGTPGGFSPVSWAGRNPIQTGFYRLPGNAPDYKVGPEDELEIFITEYSTKSVSVKVSNNGEITIPLVGTMNVTDLTTTQLEQKVSEALKAKGLINTPEVLIHVAEHSSRPIYIIGQVDFPGQYMMSQQLTLMEAIFLAGGIDFTAGRYGYLHRRTSETGQMGPPANILLDNPERAMPGTSVTRIDLQPMLDGNILEPDIPLRKGDVFVVPPRAIQMFYVIGDVGRAGAYPIPEQRSMRISQALANTGGPTRTAKLSGGKLIRLDADGTRREIPIDFGAIMKGKKEDFDVKPNDVIFIPGAQIRNVTNGMLRAVPGVLQAALLF